MKRRAARARPTRSRTPAPRDPAATVQYTVRNIPAHVDRALRRKAARERKSLNEVLRHALVRDADVDHPAVRLYTDLDALAGAWISDPGFDEVIRAQDQVDESLWR